MAIARSGDSKTSSLSVAQSLKMRARASSSAACSTRSSSSQRKSSRRSSPLKMASSAAATSRVCGVTLEHLLVRRDGLLRAAELFGEHPGETQRKHRRSASDTPPAAVGAAAASGEDSAFFFFCLAWPAGQGSPPRPRPAAARPSFPLPPALLDGNDEGFPNTMIRHCAPPTPSRDQMRHFCAPKLRSGTTWER